MSKILVMSAGHGGQATAADMAQRGHEVVLYEHPSFAATIEAINARGNVLELEKALNGPAQLRAATSNIAQAMHGAELILFTAPSYAQKAFFDLALPYFENGQVIVLTPGNFGTFALKKALRDRGVQVFVGELDNLPYVCTATEPGKITIRGVKKILTMSALPMSDYNSVDAALRAVGWICQRGDNVLHTSLGAINMVLHCIPMLMNGGRIDGATESYRFYFDGMPPSVCTAMEALDRERLAVAAAFGLSLPTSADTIQSLYGVSGENLHEILMSNTAYGSAMAPRTMRHRFLTEDTPFGLVPAAALGDAAGVPTPVMDATILFSSLTLGEDQIAVGQTLTRMGLQGKGVEDILHIL